MNELEITNRRKLAYLKIVQFSVFIIVIFLSWYTYQKYQIILTENKIKDEKINDDFNRISNELDSIKSNYNLLLHYVNEKSDIPNVKRKSIFELKIQQDSVLIELLQGDIKTNKNIIKLLTNEWSYSDKTKFKSLKTNK